MNATDTQLPQTKETTGANSFIAVHIGRNDVKLPPLMPSGNWVGMILLNQLLINALLHARLTSSEEDCGICGELNDCVFEARVLDAEDAVELIKKELDNACLLIFSQIAVRHGDDWRCVYPSPEI